MPSLEEAFVQVDTFRGWRYLDRAGVVINWFEARLPEVELKGPELSMKSRTAEPFSELRLSGQKAWLHFSQPGTLTLVVDQSQKHLSEVMDMLDVHSGRRFGFRSLWLVEMASVDEAHDVIRKAAFRSDVATWIQGSPEQVGLEQRWALADGMRITLRLNGAEREENADPAKAKRGLLIDLDVHKVDSKGEIPTGTWRRFAQQAAKLSQSTVARIVEAFGVD